MIIQCDRCNTRFRLEDSKVTEKGVKVRCSKCQNIFVVKPPPPQEEFPVRKEPLQERPEERPSPPPPQKWEKRPFEVSFGQETPPTPERPEEGPTSWGMDFSFDEKPAPEEPKREEIPVTPKEEEGPPPLEIKREKETVPEETFIKESYKPSIAEGAVAVSTPPEVPPPVESYHEEFIGKEETTFSAPSRRRIPLGRIILGIFLLLIIGGASVFYLKGGADIIFNLWAPISNLWAPQKATVGKLDIVGLKHYYGENPSMGKFFVIEGKVLSSFEGPKGISGIKGTIFDSKGKGVEEKSVAPGRVISEEELKTISKEELAKRFKDPLKGSIPPKGTIPFMIVFPNPPNDLAEFAVEVLQ